MRRTLPYILDSSISQNYRRKRLQLMAGRLVLEPLKTGRDRAAMIGARLMVAEGRIERETEHAEVPITHLICRKLIDRGDLLRQLSISANDPSWADATLRRADEVRRPDPGSARAKAGLLASRDFR